MNTTEDECARCVSTLVEVRPGKWQCQKCELDNMLQQAHREIEELHSRINNYIYEYSLEVMKDCPECANILRATTEEVAKAHKRGWKQAKREAVYIAAGQLANPFGGAMAEKIADAIAAMEYRGKAND